MSSTKKPAVDPDVAVFVASTPPPVVADNPQPVVTVPDDAKVTDDTSPTVVELNGVRYVREDTIPSDSSKDAEGRK